MAERSAQPDATPRGNCPRCHYAVIDTTRACPECGLDAAEIQSAISHQTSAIPFRPWLHRFAMLFVLATFILLVLGGTVTSKGVGLAVPDWPTTFEYNMFLFPPSMWVGGIFWEHTHRLMGSLVGLMAIAMCIWLWQTNTQTDFVARPGAAIAGSRPWLKWLGVATLIMVIGQGVMGGLRVTQLSTTWAIFHGITAQLFLCMTVLIAAATSRWWTERSGADSRASAVRPQTSGGNMRLARVRRAAVIVLVALFIQLALGATVRHHGAGLAIPDFPLSYGQVVPPLTQAEIESAMIRFADQPDEYASTQHGWYTPLHVALHWSHRLWAIVAVAAVINLVVRVFRGLGHEPRMKTAAVALGAMVLLQVALGATVIWTGRHPEVATGHQTLGAVLLATAALILYRTQLLASRDSTGVHPATPSADAPRADRLDRRVVRGPLSVEGAGA